MGPSRGGYVLAIDLGTSGPKVALCSWHGEVARWEYEITQLYLLPGGGAEQDPDAWWRAISSAARRLLARGLVPPAAIRAVGCAGQWSGTVPVDRGGQALGNAIIWMDSRGAPYVQRLIGGRLAVDGYGLDKSITLHWVADNRDLRRVRYDPRLARRAGLALDKLPELVRAVDWVGSLRPEVASEWGLPAGLPVVAGMPDIHSAAVGSGGSRRLRGPPLSGHLLPVGLSRTVQEVRPIP